MYDKEAIGKELQFSTVASGGKGGQHANKVATKVQLSFDIQKSAVLSAAQKAYVLQFHGSRLTTDGILQLSADAERSQYLNKKEVVKRFHRLLTHMLTPPRKRIKTKPSRAAREKRLKNKKLQAEKKRLRRGRWEE
ncbi:MAG: alternative ribosome rescue aminoacyl-tRNA hydrolase ArfB [Bacteroidota bacterium]